MSEKIDALRGLALADRIAPRLEEAPDNDKERCCEWTLATDRKRTRKELIPLINTICEFVEGRFVLIDALKQSNYSDETRSAWHEIFDRAAALASGAAAPNVFDGEFSEDWKAGFSAGCDAVLNPAPRLATIFPELEERIRRIEPPSDVVGGQEGYGFMRGIDAARAEIRRAERIYRKLAAAPSLDEADDAPR